MSGLSKILGRLRRKSAVDVLELKILGGEPIRPRTNQPSVLFFTIHKAASTYVNQVIRDVLAAARYQHVDLYGYSFRNDQQKAVFRNEHFYPRGLYYGALREPIEVDPEKNCKTILQVRDPRDVITSFYFSYCYSHAAPNHEERKQRFEQTRQRIREMQIDEYAIRHRMNIYHSLNTYAQNFFTRPDVLVVHYEDMVNDFPRWLDRVIEFLGVRRTERLQRAIDAVNRNADFDVDREDVYSHKRQVKPGDHLRKLKPETIEFLNREFHSYFEKMAETNNLPVSYQLPDLSFDALQAEREVA